MTKKPTLPGLDLATEHAREPPGAVPLLTVIVPVYNEAETISEQLARIVAAPYSKQVIVVDDGSTDGTAGALGAWQDDARFKFLRHEANRGAGAAIRTALPYARGRFTIIQDADLEYDPEDYPRLVEPLLAGETRVVFGSRFLPETPQEPFSKRAAAAVRTMKSRARSATKAVARSAMSAPKAVLWGWMRKTDAEGDGKGQTDLEVHPTGRTDAKGDGKGQTDLEVHPTKRQRQRWGARRLGAAGLKLATRLLYGAPLSDVAAGPKVFSTELLRKLDLQCERFEFGPEVAAKLSRAGEKIVEVPVRFEHRVARDSWLVERFAARRAAALDRGSGRRPVAEKHRWTDGPRTLATLWRWRRWAPLAPDPHRIPAVPPAVVAAGWPKPAADEAASAAIEADIDHWVEEDASRSGFDPAA
jgi:hypothetical protein